MTINYEGKTYKTTGDQLKQTPLKSAIHPNWFYTVKAVNNANKVHIIWFCIPDHDKKVLLTAELLENIAFIRKAK